MTTIRKIIIEPDKAESAKKLTAWLADQPEIKQASHSPLPWSTMANINENSELHPLCSIWSGRETKESIVCNSCSPADAKLIVRACNNAQRLAGALRKVVFNATHGNGLQAQRDTLNQAREALAQWEKEGSGQ